ncbi:TIGR04255 family protein [Rhodococcus qingshengii]|uniref:TIGR04255 family protein n=1 Tax=Rhodococcus qingshengii TaxID=334542 RepID=A0AAW6LWH8_RHOSG|nr:TIGR04255 family protein [Rhodococcus qingshengii]MDE8649492.1 TIGR04255 family protein [Rhodococcus qingshengii]
MTIDPRTLLPAEDIPLGGLPPADPTLLGNAPLEVAVIEIRYTAPASEIAPEAAAALRDDLVANTGVDYPSIQPTVQQQMRIDFGANGVSQVAAESRGWQIVSADGSGHITLMPDILIVQINRYERWRTSMKEPLTVLLESLEKLVRPSLVHRIGLRYVDRFHNSGFDSAAAWRGRIDDTLLGPVLNRAFGDSVQGAQQQVEIRLDDHHGALLRHGPVRDDGGKCVQYLLDTDVFRHSSFTFDVREVVVSAERLNRTALSLFQASVTETYLKELREGGER